MGLVVSFSVLLSIALVVVGLSTSWSCNCGVVWRFHVENWREIHVERAKIVLFVAIFCLYSFIQPVLESCIDRKEEFGWEFLSRCSFALKIDLWWLIIFITVSRHWDPTLRSPKKMSFVMMNISSCSYSSWKFIGG